MRMALVGYSCADEVSALYARPGLDGADRLRGARVGVDVPGSGFALAMYAVDFFGIGQQYLWPGSPWMIEHAGGITAMQILPGSANLIGGRSVVLKNVPARTVQAMKFPGAKQGLKMACGENPKRVYGEKGRTPMTRMGNFALDDNGADGRYLGHWSILVSRSSSRSNRLCQKPAISRVQSISGARAPS